MEPSHPPTLVVRLAHVPEDELLVVAHRPKQVTVPRVPRHVLQRRPRSGGPALDCWQRVFLHSLHPCCLLRPCNLDPCRLLLASMEGPVLPALCALRPGAAARHMQAAAEGPRGAGGAHLHHAPVPLVDVQRVQRLRAAQRSTALLVREAWVVMDVE